MSKTIDEKVVSMQFDNKHFESNVKTTMSTLDRLKQSLNLTGASKGLENVNAAAGKVNMSGLASGVESVRMKFSALEVMGVTALANITNSAVNAGKNIVSALTIQPITTGFNEYELKMDSVKTIVASTGEELSTVNKYLEELNEYSDQTIYSFSDMTQNIGKFTNAGVKLEDAVMAIKGISNEAAVSGANANEASRAMYNFAQALSAGYVKLIDWKSIENANMATVEFKQQLIDTAVALGTVTKAGDGMYTTLAGNTFSATQNFNEVFQDQWMTSEVLVETLKDYADETTDIGKKAKAAAQDVTKFTQVFDILKETAQSGWAKTWELLFGDLEQAKSIFTPMSNFLNGIIDKMSDWRNNILEKALGSPFAGLSDRIQQILNPVEKVTSAVDTAISTIENLDEIANKVIRGDYKNTDTGRRQNLMAEGYNWAVVQNRVNEILGCTVRHSEEAAEAELKLYQAEHGLVEKGNELSKTQDTANESRAKTVEELLAMTDAELEALGLTKEEIKALRDLKKICDQTGVSMEEALGDPDKLSGRTLLINAFKNAASGLVGIFKAMGEAWRKVFYGDASDEEILAKQSQGLYGIIAAIHKFSECLRLTDSETGKLNSNGDKLRRTFAGIFAIIDLITDIIGGTFKIAFQIVSAVLGYFNLNILDVTAAIGDALVKFRDWVKKIFDVNEIVTICIDGIKVVVGWIKDWVTSNESLNSALETLKGFLSPVVKHIKNLFNALKGAESLSDVIKIMHDWVMNVVTAIGTWASSNDKLSGTFGKIVSYIQPVITAVQEWINGLKETDNVPKYIIEGLVNGIKIGIPKAIEAIFELGAQLIKGFCEILGIHSPSTVFIALGAFILAGLIGGITGGAGKVFGAIKDVAGGIIESFDSIDVKGFFTAIGDFFKGIFSNIAEILGSIDWGSLIALAVSIGLVVAVAKIAKALETLATPLKSFSEVLESVSGAFDELGGYFKAAAWEKRTKGIMNLATAIAIMAAAIFLLASVEDLGRLWNAVGIIAVLAGVMVALSFAVEKMSGASVSISKEGASFSNLNTALIGLTASLLLMAVAAKLIAGMSWEQLGKAGIGLAAFLVVIGGIFLAYGKLGKGGANLDKVGTMLVKMAGSMLLLVIVAKLINSMTWTEMGKAAAGLTGLVGIMTLLMLISKIGNAKKIGTMLIQMAVAMGLLVLVAKMIARMEWSEMGKAATGLLGLAGIVAILMLISKIGNSKKIGTMLLGMAGAMAILVLVAKLIVSMEWSEMGKAAVGLAGLAGIIAILVSIVKLAGKDAPKIAATLLAMAGAVGILAIVAVMLGWVDLAKLAQGVIAVSILSTFMALMAKQLQGANNVMGSLIVLATSIAVMASAVALLTLIDPARLAIATGCLSLLMGMFAVIENYSTTITSAQWSLLIMSGAVAVMGGILFLLGQLQPQNAIASAIGLSILLGVVTGVTVVLSKISTNIKNALFGVLALTLMAVPLLAFVGVLALMSGVKNAIANATALSMLAAVLTVLLVPLCAIGMLITATMGLCLLGIAGLLLMAVPLLAFVGILAIMQNIENATANTLLLILLGEALTGMLIKLSIIAPLALVGVVALSALVGLIVAVGALATAIGYLMTEFPALKDFLNTGLPLLEQLALSLGTMIGNFVAGFSSAIASSLPYIGEQLSAFMIAAMPFILGAKMIDSGVLLGVGVLAASILALTVADLVSGVTSFLTGGLSFGQLGTELSTFITNAMPFILGIKMLDPAAVEGAKAMAEMILILTAANLLDQLTSWLGGESSLSTFAQELVPFGEAMVLFSQTVSGKIDEGAVTAAANAGKCMAEMAKTLPNSGGVVGFFAGENDMDVFGQQLVVFGDCIAKFSETVTGRINEDAVAAAANAGKMMIEMAETIPNTGGLVGWFMGDNDMATFGQQLELFGEAMVNYSKEVTGVDTEAIKVSVGAASELAKLQNSLDKTGGLVSMFTGDKGLDTFGENLKKFGKAMVEYSGSVEDISARKLTASTTSFAEIVKMAKSVQGVDFAGMDSFGKALKKLGKSGVDEFVKAFDDGEEDVRDAGEDLIDSAKQGLESYDTPFRNAAQLVAQEGAEGVKDKVGKFKSAGKDLGAGLVKGIKEKKDDVYDAGYALGQAAVQGEKDGQKSNSPSKLTIQAGHWLGEGLVVGMKQMGNKVYSAGSRLGEKATGTISDTIARIGDAINGDIDNQPTIRPVLDLSAVSAGAGTISDMFNTNPSVGVLSNIRSINTMMNKRQNGNDEVISALNDLKDSFGRSTGDTYSINGVNVNEGTDVADAIKVITRAAIQGRRM